MGYEPLVNVKLIDPSYPPEIKLITKEETFQWLEEMVNRFRKLLQIKTLLVVEPAMDFFIDFNRENPCVLTRSALPLLYRSCSDIVNMNYPFTMANALRAAAIRFVTPPSLTMENFLGDNVDANKRVDDFFIRCARYFALFFITFALNKGQQHRELKQIVEGFSALQDHAGKLDLYLHDICVLYRRSHVGCFKTWITYYTLRITNLYFTMGLELELYAQHEYHYMFWQIKYLYERISEVLRTATTILRDQEIRRTTLQGATKKKSNLTTTNTQWINTHAKEATFYGALLHMADAFYKTSVAFEAEGKLNVPRQRWSIEKCRYKHRFEICNYIQDSYAVTYDQFKDITACHRTKESLLIKSLYLEASQDFMDAAELLEQIPHVFTEITNLIKVAKTNMITLKLVAGGQKKQFTMSPTFDFTTHPHFPVIKFIS